MRGGGEGGFTHASLTRASIDNTFFTLLVSSTTYYCWFHHLLLNGVGIGGGGGCSLLHS
jgi:hypothetical protein